MDIGYCLSIIERRTNQIVIRINEYGLHEAANFTKQWLQRTIPNTNFSTIEQNFEKGFASGRILLKNMQAKKFIPPHIHFHPSDHSFIYMTTESGFFEISSDFLIDSQFFSLLHIPLGGTVDAQISGLQSEIGMQVTAENRLEIYRCDASILDLKLHFGGSLAADVIHWFRRSLSNAIQQQLEIQLCDTITTKWLPWVKEQIGKFPVNITINAENPEVLLLQTVHSVSMTQNHIDLRMRSDLLWDGELIENDPETPNPEMLLEINKLEPSSRMIDMFIEEETVQNIIAATHFAGHFNQTVVSQFLRTNCEVLCVGTVLPELKQTLPNRTLKVQVVTLNPPIIILQNKRAIVRLNVSLEVFAEPALENHESTILSISAYTEFVLTMEIVNKRLKGYVSMVTAKAALIENKLDLLSQKTVDFLINMSKPFLEDAVDMFFGHGLLINDPFKFPSINEHLSINRKCLRFQTDLVIQDDL
uniref:BPI2 domain-containing protein n=1 Tax=Syphacia muris TaxID=451379 RepID=A0A0N5AHY3_9BILA